MGVEERRAELLTFGRRFFAEHAFDAMSMDAIAGEAGVSKALLYHYFGGRRGFYVATVESVAGEVIALTAPEPDVSFEVALRRSLGRLAVFVRGNGGIFRALLEGGVGADEQARAVVEEVRERGLGHVATRLGVDEPTGLFRIALYSWVCFTEAACLAWLDQPEVDEPELVELLVQALAPALNALPKATKPPTPNKDRAS